MTPSNEDGPIFFTNSDDWATASRIALAAVTSQGTMGGLLVAGFVCFFYYNQNQIKHEISVFVAFKNRWVEGDCRNRNGLWWIVHV
jgi:hypothetical protein